MNRKPPRPTDLSAAGAAFAPVCAPVLAWFGVLAALVALMVIVGGATRLTDSGLSITEWKPITGAIPPLSQAAWLDAFEKYRQIPEYEIINKGMSLDEFKSIFWWEWGHRFLGRFIGVAFLVPFVIFLLRRQIAAWLMPRVVTMFVLGGLQGALGWYMVMSGLVDRVDVSQYRLAAHLGAACFIFGFILWTAFAAAGMRPSALPGGPGRRTAMALVVLLFAQILLGALVAGTDAGFSHNSWPLMDGSLIPGGLFAMHPWYGNFFENVRTVQFDHRMMAYAIWALTLIQAVRLTRHGSGAAGGAWLLVTLTTAQAALGIWTLLAVVPLGLGLAHQFGALILFAAALAHAARFVPLRMHGVAAASAERKAPV